jgi:dipeptidyl-peptidase-4
MHRNPRRFALAALLVASAATGAQPPIDASVYDRASRFVYQNTDRLVLNRSVMPHWRMDGGENFTYVRELGEGRSEFVRVDAATGARSRPFDPQVVAQGLATATGKPVEADRLPFRDYDRLDAGRVRFQVGETAYTCSTAKPSCDAQPIAAADPLAIPSPDGKWLAYVRDHNLWIRSADGSQNFALTRDGEAHYAYAATLEADPLVTDKVLHGQPVAPVVLWSPDSRRLYTQRLDERDVREATLVQSAPPDGSTRPRLYRWRYPGATDPVQPVAEQWLFDIEARSGQRVAMDPILALVTTAIEAKEAWWSGDSRSVYVYARSRYYKSMSLHQVDAASGHARTVIEESARTFVEAGSIGQRPMVYTLTNGEVLWFSERDGRGHLYVYDRASGALKRRLTTGDWSVRGVLHLDEPHGLIYVAGSEREPGADPYFRKVYRIGLADGSVKLLTPEDADHGVASAQDSAYFDPPASLARDAGAARGFAPTGRYFLDSYSRTDLPAETVLRRADGRLVAVIERADVSRLLQAGMPRPERFSALAADGRTRLYGNLLRPSDFDPSRRYPVIDSLYPGPQARKAYPRFVEALFGYSGDQSIAELGFVVVQLDGRGTPGRSKSFLDESYGRLGRASDLDDHVAVVRQLAGRYPYLDLGRVGVLGGSAGGYAALRALLTHADFYKVGVSAAGSHDPEAQGASYSETFMGPDDGANYRVAANAPLAGNLTGRLLLIHGDLDWTVNPGNTLRVVDALIRNNKDFDLLIVPNADHSPLNAINGYVLRRIWDYLVVNLMDARPPPGYKLDLSGLAH